MWQHLIRNCENHNVPIIEENAMASMDGSPSNNNTVAKNKKNYFKKLLTNFTRPFRLRQVMSFFIKFLLFLLLFLWWDFSPKETQSMFLMLSASHQKNVRLSVRPIHRLPHQFFRQSKIIMANGCFSSFSLSHFCCSLHQIDEVNMNAYIHTKCILNILFVVFILYENNTLQWVRIK